MSSTFVKGFVGGLALGATILISAAPTPLMADDTGMATSLHSVRRERGKLCMSSHYHSGASSRSHRSKRRAKRDAIKAWRGFTIWEYGTDWGNYRRAGSKSMRCSKSRGGWSCNTEARPCRRR